MIDALEPRRLLAATSTFRDGILRIIGTDESERIAVTLVPAGQAEPGSGVSVIRGGGNPQSKLEVLVTIGDEEKVRINAADVRGINIFGNGGKDLITGFNAVGTSPQLDGNGDRPLVSAIGPRLYIEGGSGNDRIVGGARDDLIYGGRGNDSIVDLNGSNFVDGGAGDDHINVLEAPRPTIVAVDPRDPSTGFVARRPITPDRGSRDTIIGGAGDDTVRSNGDDIVSGVDDDPGQVVRAN